MDKMKEINPDGWDIFFFNKINSVKSFMFKFLGLT